jgi:hypothetical protein
VLLLPSSESGNTIVPSVVQYTKDGKIVVGEAAKVRLPIGVQKHEYMYTQSISREVHYLYAWLVCLPLPHTLSSILKDLNHDC